MKNALTFLFLIITTTMWAQYETNDSGELDYKKNIEVVTASQNLITPTSSVSVRFSTQSNVYLKWESVEGASVYRLSYKAAGTSSKWKTVECLTNELVLEGLPLDVDFLWTISSLDASGSEAISSTAMFSTFPQAEPIKLSENLYSMLSSWFANKKNQIPFCEYLDGLPVNMYEKLAFLQVYSFENAPMVFRRGSTIMSDWYPVDYNGTDCLGFDFNKDITANCNCKVLTVGSNFATPSEGLAEEERRIIPVPNQYIDNTGGIRTYVDLYQAGAAKFASLRQDDSRGEMDYSLSNIQGSNASQFATTAASRIKFVLGCVVRGGFSTNLPKECECERPLKVAHEYTTKLLAQAKTKTCLWSKGSLAHAEDLAFVTVLNESSGNVNLLDAGQAMVGSECDQSWNPQFWIRLLDVAEPALLFLAESAGEGGTGIPTEEQITDFVDALQILIGTPFRSHHGECNTEKESQVLVSGTSSLMLIPNEPLVIGLFSSYYIRTRGYGCWTSSAAVASDYYLAGIVESAAERGDEECCSDKLANFILGSLSHPLAPSNGGDAGVYMRAENSLASRMGNVGFFLSGSDWEGVEISQGSGNPIIKGEYGLLRGPSCGDTEPIGDDKRFDGGDKDANSSLIVYPAASSDWIVVENKEGGLSSDKIIIYNAQGAMVAWPPNGRAIEEEGTTVTLDISDFPAGRYWLHVKASATAETIGFIKI